MEIAWPRVLPVLVSIVVIVLIAIVSEQSRVLAAVVTTIPVKITLAMWLVSVASEGDSTRMTELTGSVFAGLIATLSFAFVAWMAARAGHGLLPILGFGYLAWAVVFGAGLAVQRAFGAL
jgi:hypothetical protein